MINTFHKCFLSVVIPTFNEAGRILPTLESVVSYLRLQAYSWEIVIVDDGSLDRTPYIVSNWVKENIVEGESCSVISVGHQGKGSAIKLSLIHI